MMNMAGNAQRWFMDACKRGDFKQAMKLLPEVGGLRCVEESYALRNTFVGSSSEDWQWTPFHYAAKYGELEFIRDFFNLFSSSLANALTKRIIPGRTRTRTGLTGETIFPHPKSVSGYKDLHFGPRLKVSRLKDSKGRKPLHVACGHGHLPILHFYIDVVKCDLQCRDNLDRTPLHYASEQGHVRIVQCLIEDGLCEPNCCDSNQQTSLQIAYDVGQTAMHVVDYMTNSESGMYEYTNSNGDLETSTNAACDRFDSSKVPLLPAYVANTLENRALAIVCPKGLKERTLPQSCWCNIDVDVKGRTKLHIACGKRYIEVVKAVLSSCAHHINMQDNIGRTALHFACNSLFGAGKRNDIVADLLATKECDPSITDNKGRSALHIACDVGDPELVSTLLIHSNVDINAQDEKGKTPLHYVLERKMSQKIYQENIVRILLSYEQCDINVVDINGCTPLEVALYKQNFKIVKMLQFLTKHASNVNEYTMQLHLACARGDCDSVHTMLYDAKFRAALQSRNVITALHISCASHGASSSSHKWKTIIKELLAHPHCQVSATDNYGRNALHIACIHGSSKMTSLLLSLDQSVINIQDVKGRTPLHYACMHSNTCIKSLLDCKNCDTTLVESDDDDNNEEVVLLDYNECDPNLVDKDGNTPLQIALSRQKYMAVKLLLLSSKCNPNTNINGYTPLHCVCEEGDLELVSLILSDRQYRSDMQCSDGKTPLHSACSSEKVSFLERLKIVRMLLAHRPSLVSAIDNTGRTALHFAVTTGDSKTVSLLLSTETNLINVQDNEGQTPLHYACLNTRESNEEVVELLLACNKCDPNVVDKDGNTPLQMALSRQNYKAVKLLLIISKCNPNTNINGYTLLHFVCKKGDLELVSLILSDREYRSDMQCSDGKTPLHSACSSQMVSFSERLKIVRMLLAHRPSLVSAIDNTGRTALHFAVTTGDSETVSLLLSTEASLINVQEDQGETPLQYSCWNYTGKNKEVVKLLLADNKCDLNVLGEYGNTSLQVALSRQNYAAVKLLLLSKCNPNTNINGYTPLHFVCEEGDLELVSLILSDREYRSDMQCSDGKTPLHSVCSSSKVSVSNRLKIVRKLLAHRPSLVSAIDNTDHTALHFAVTTGDSETVSLLLSTEASLINVQDDQGQTPLHYACLKSSKGNNEVVKLLLSHNECDLNVVDKGGNTPFKISLACHNYDAARLLMENSKCDLSIGFHPLNPLHYACVENDTRMVSIILSSGKFQINAQDPVYGKTALHYAFIETKINEELVKALTAEGKCDISIADNNGETALQIVCKRRLYKIIRILLLSSQKSILDKVINNTFKGLLILHVACAKSDYEMIECLASIENCLLNVQDETGITPLHITCQRNDIRALRLLLFHCGTSLINVQDDQGQTPLHYVCLKSSNGNNEVFRLLLSHNECDLNVVDIDGNTPFKISVTHHNYDAACLLMENSKCDLSIGFRPLNPLRLKIVRKLLAHRPSLVSAIDNTGRTVIHFAVATGDSETMSLLLSAKASLINVQDDQGLTPLHYACLKSSKGNNEVVKLLLSQNECDLNVVDKDGNTPFKISVTYHNYDAACLLMENSKCDLSIGFHPLNPLHCACVGNDTRMVSIMLSSGKFQINAQDPVYSETALHYACIETKINEELVKALTAEGKCDISIDDDSGETALQIVCKRRLYKIIRILLLSSQKSILDKVINNTFKGLLILHVACAKSDYEMIECLASIENCLLNVQDETGITPLHITCQRNDIRALRLLLFHCGTSLINVQDDQGQTPLHYVCLKSSNGNNEVFRLLLSHNECDLNVVDIDGNTPFKISVTHHNYDAACLLMENSKCDLSIGFRPLNPLRLKIVRKLLAHRPSLVSAIDNTGRTVIHFAVATGDSETMSLLLSAKASLINVQDDQGLTPLHYACLKSSKGNNEVVKLLLSQNECDLNVVDKDGNTPFKISVTYHNYDAACLLMENSKCDLSIGFHPLNPLHCACVGNDTRMVSIMLSSGKFQINAQDPVYSETALHYACIETKINEELVKALTAEGKCDISIDDDSGETALQIVCKRRLYKIIRILLLSSQKSILDKVINNTFEGFSILHVACAKSDYEMIECLVSIDNCLLNIKDETGITSLHITCQRNDIRALRLLLFHCGTSLINVQDDQGQTPLHYVCLKSSNGNNEVFRLLLSHNECDLNVVDIDGNTPFKISVTHHNYDAARLLMENSKCDLSMGFRPLNPLRYACVENDTRMVSIMLSSGKFQINAQDPVYGKTALHYACIETKINEELVEALTAEGKCDISIADNNGETALQIVCKRKLYKIIRILLLSSQKSILDKVINNTFEGFSILHIACAKSDYEMIECLVSIENCLLNIKDETGITSLHITCQRNDIRALRLLLFHCGTSLINVQDDQGQTPLHYVCFKSSNGNNEVFRLLLSHNECDLNVVDIDGNTPFKISVTHHNYDAACLLMENSKCDLSIGFHPLNPLCYACVENDTRMVSIMLSSGKFQVNAQDPVYGKTALHYACIETKINEELVEALTAEGKCDISIADNSGETALQIAFKRELYEIIRIFLLSSQKSILDKMGEYISTQTLVIGNRFEGFSILHVACAKSDYEMIECLVSIENCFLNIKDETWTTPLHIACKNNDIRAVRILVSNEKCDTTVLNKYGNSALEYTNDYDIIRELYRHGANPSPLYHRYVLNRRKIPTSFVKVFVLGDSGVGKTTLVESLQKEYLALVRAFIKNQKISEVELKTAGIVPNDFNSKDYGRVTLYDFAGQKQYFGSHETFLNNAVGNCPPIFVLVVDISANQALHEKLLFWITFLRSTCLHISVKPHIIIICSHVDVLKDANEDPLARFSVIEQVMTSPAFSWCHFAGIVGMDCRLPNSSDMSTLRQIMTRSCDTLRIKPRMAFNCHCFFVFLLDKFRESLAITVDMVQTAIQREPEASKSSESHLSFIPDTVSRLCQICDKLDDHGHLIFIKDSTQLEKSWIIIDKASLFHKVTGAIFAPEGFKENFNLSSSTGVVPFSKMKGKFFPEYDIEMLMCFLSHMEFCNEVTDRKLLKLLTEGQSISATDRYFFFPSLVTVDASSDVWSSDMQCEFRLGWCLKCRDADFFTPRFVQVLILRLAFIYALASDTQHSGTDSLPLPVIHRKCQVWKNGIFWGTKEGIECLVSIDEDSKTLLLLMKSPRINQACLKYRSTLLTKIMYIKEDLMCGLKAVKYVIQPSDSQYPLPPVNAISLDEINEAIIECNEAVVTSTGKIFTVDHLLVFEPYAKLGREILEQLFCSQKQKRKISDEFLLRLASQWVERKKIIMKIFNPDPILLSGKIREMDTPGPASEILCTLQLWRDIDGDNEGTYKCLREKLDQFSICCGKNPLVSIIICICNDLICSTGARCTCLEYRVLWVRVPPEAAHFF